MRLISHITTVFIAIGTFLFGAATCSEVITEKQIEYHNVVDTHYVHSTDTILLYNGLRFNTIEEYILFIKYVKTQSNRVTDTLGQSDVWSIIQTMYNRMDDAQMRWYQFYNDRKANNSASMKKMQTGQVKIKFDWDNWKDLWMLSACMRVQHKQVPDSLRLPDNVLYFEACKRSPNRCPHYLKNLHVTYRHRFYTGTLRNHTLLTN